MNKMNGPLFDCPWHKTSWDRFLSEYLPELIGANCDLRRYQVDRSGGTCTITLEVEGSESSLTVEYNGIPLPDERGVFTIDDGTTDMPMVIMPIANEPLTVVRCVGELLRDFLASRLAPAPEGVLTSQAAVGAWFPLEELTAEFFSETAGRLDDTNSIAEGIHMRRVRLRLVGDFTPPSDIAPKHQIGLLCPIEFPEGPNCGLVLTVARGAEIRDGALVRKESSADVSEAPDPVSMLGPTASYIPFIERNDPARLMMGANMMRQWIVPLAHESAMVQTGTEPDSPDFWCGFNLLTAYASYGRLTYDDAIVVSESAAVRMQCAAPLAVGDKLSNRHGQKGLVSRILPDSEMPKIPDGRTVDLLFSFSGLHTRMKTGELWEAIYSWLVERGEADAIVPQFASPSREEIESALKKAGCPERGMVRLTLPDGEATEKPVVVGTVYWGRLHHTAASKFKVSGSDQPRQVQGEMEYWAMRQVQGEMEYWAMREAGAFSAVLEANSIAAEGSAYLEESVRAIERGDKSMLPGSSVKLQDLTSKLKLAGIETHYSKKELSFRFGEAKNDETVLVLPEPMTHPWRTNHRLVEIPQNPDSPLWSGLVRSAERLRSLLQSDAPQKLLDSSRRSVTERIGAYFDELIVHQDFVPRGRRHFSGRTVIVPAGETGPNQIGVPEEMAWTLFGPHVTALVGPEANRKRTSEAKKALDAVMSERWVYINRAPTLSPAAMLGFKPVAVGHRAIELHPLVCRWLNADYDGDQIALFHPLTDAAQKDASDKLSIAGHLRRNPALVRTLVPTQDSLWGLAALSRDEIGRSRIAQVLTKLPEMPEGYLTERSLADFSVTLLDEVGPERVVEILGELYDLGITEAMRRGGSMNPFMQIPASVRESNMTRAEIVEGFAGSNDFDDPDFGSQLLLIKSGARGSIEHLVMLCHSRPFGAGVPTLIPQTYDGDLADLATPANAMSREQEHAEYTATGHLDGVLAPELFLLAREARKHIHELVTTIQSSGHRMRSGNQPKGYGILARAVRTEYPGIVIGSAAATGETDPIADIDASLFVGEDPGA
jgi:hypothetical protein